MDRPAPVSAECDVRFEAAGPGTWAMYWTWEPPFFTRAEWEALRREFLFAKAELDVLDGTQRFEN